MDEEEAKSKLIRRIVWIHFVGLIFLAVTGFLTSLFVALLLSPLVLIVLTGYFGLKETRKYRKNKESRL